MTPPSTHPNQRWAVLALLMTHLHAGAQGTPILPPLPAPAPAPVPAPTPAPTPAPKPKETPAEVKARQAREKEAAADKREVERLKTEAAQLKAAAERDRKAKAEAEARAARAENELADKTRATAAAPSPAPPAAPAAAPAPVATTPTEITRLFAQQPARPAVLEAYAGGPVLRALPQATDNRAGTLLGQADSAYSYEKPTYRVRVPYALYMGETEVTFAQWDQCVRERGCSENPKDDWGRGDQPVMRVNWHDTQEFLVWINKKAGTDQLDKSYWFRLPTEAEWEYAARAGSGGEFSLGPGNNLALSPATANYDGNYQYNGSPKGEYRSKTVPVKASPFQPNAWGLWHMHGNVWEWVQDCYSGDEYQRREKAAGGWLASQTSEEKANCNRVLRGGSWYSLPQYLPSAYRFYYPAGNRGNVVGFRLARTLP